MMLVALPPVNPVCVSEAALTMHLRRNAATPVSLVVIAMVSQPRTMRGFAAWRMARHGSFADREHFWFTGTVRAWVIHRLPHLSPRSDARGLD